jgi:putative FmdB family regulatory protein
MPTYEYECKSCGHSFETFQSMNDDPLKVCPQCGKELRRLINGGSGIIFKGSGFYVTDKKGSGAASSAPKPAAKAAGSAPPAQPSGGETAKAESKSPPEKKAAG